MMQKHRWLPLALLFGFLLLTTVACGFGGVLPGMIANPVTTMQVVYNGVYQGSYAAWGTAVWLAPLGWAAFTLVLSGLGLFMVSRSGKPLLLAVVLAVGVFFFNTSSLQNARPERADQQATHAMIDGVDQAKYDIGNTFVEILQVPAVAAPVEEKECHKSVDSRSNCWPYEWTHEINHRTVCTGEGDDRTCRQESDTEHVPYFSKLVRYTIVVNLYQGLATPETGLVHSGVDHFPKRLLSDWIAPADYNNYWFGRSRRDMSPGDYVQPADWVRWSNELNRGEIPLISLYHRYPNWLLVTDNIFGISTHDVPRYQDVGLLPTMNEIYSQVPGGWAADYDAVQFVGSLAGQVSPQENDAWQQAFYPFGGFFANDRQSAAMVIFANRADVEAMGTLDQWADAGKAYHSIEENWPIFFDGETLKRMLPKNQLMLFCAVNPDRSISPDGCRLRTGMPRGNETIINQYAYDGVRPDQLPEMQEVVFDPARFFGNVQTQLVPLEGSPYPVVQLVSQNPSPMSMMLRADPEGIRRIEMAESDYLMSDIQLSKADIDKLIRKEVAVQKAAASSAITTAWGFFFGLIVALIGLAGAANSKRYTKVHHHLEV